MSSIVDNVSPLHERVELGGFSFFPNMRQGCAQLLQVARAASTDELCGMMCKSFISVLSLSNFFFFFLCGFKPSLMLISFAC